MISIIVAIGENHAIGQNNNLLCHLPNDLKYFKEKTNGKTVIMGKRTYYSLPKHPLPNRRNIIITSAAGEVIEGAEVAYSIADAVALTDKEAESFVIGGGMVYRQFMEIADKLYITHIHHSWPEADTFFPEIDLSVWRKIAEQFNSKDEKNPFDYTFTEYIRK